MSKLQQAQQRSADGPSRLLTKKKIANYSYILTDQLGEGYSSKVYRGLNETTNCPVAIKAIDMARINNDIHQQLLQSEIECLKKVSRCHHVIQFLDVHATKNNTYIVTEYCQEGDLSKIIQQKGLPEHLAVNYMKQIIAGYLEIHRKGIVHRDLKPTNIFVKERLLKIADFGFAVRSEDCKKSSKYNIGSPLYMPPEALLYNQYSYKSDVWALGIIFYQLLTGAAPWNAKTEKELANKIMGEGIFRKIPDSLSVESIDFLTRTLECSTNDRMSPEELKNFHFGNKDERPVVNQSIHSLTSAATTNTTMSSRLPLRGSNRISSYQQAPTPKNTYTDTHLPPIVPDEQRISDTLRKQTSRQLLAQIHLCRFLYKLIKRMEQTSIDSAKLKQLFSHLILNKLSVLLTCDHSNPFLLEKFKEYRQTSDYTKFLAVAKQYQQKYRQELSSYSRTLKSDNFEDISDEIRSTIQLLYEMLKDIDPDDAPKQKQHIILADYLVTTYQLVQLAARNDAKQFARRSKIETIVEGQPASINYAHLKAVEDKLVLLGFI